MFSCNVTNMNFISSSFTAKFYPLLCIGLPKFVPFTTDPCLPQPSYVTVSQGLKLGLQGFELLSTCVQSPVCVHVLAIYYILIIPHVFSRMYSGKLSFSLKSYLIRNNKCQYNVLFLFTYTMTYCTWHIITYEKWKMYNKVFNTLTQ